ncbi:glycosyltransferase family 1 protein [Filobacillus milosensis]|uniref:Glycosyltransferase family 1 protein n=1 Tax=Filobacillus milosensis TaxID=94137 RepID=A0A4Y8IE14_9BACI|nr:glycosyltransferase [Filobacillus milosensis]TFB14176.1 glycosyltransferase family 1 protein [Filobacillus milosensis]
MKILFFTDSKLTSPSRYRIFQYQKYLKKDKIKAKYSKLYSERFHYFRMKYRNNFLGKIVLSFNWLFAAIKRLIIFFLFTPFYDIVHINRDFIPNVNVRFKWYLDLFNTKLVYEFDDALFLTQKPTDKIKYLISASNQVISGNEYLNNYAERFNQNTVIIPTVVDKDLYSDIEKDSKNDKTFIIGWIGAPTTIENLDIIVEPLNRFVDKYNNVHFKFICDDDHGYLDKINNSSFVKWNLSTYLKELSEIDIGVMPLYDNEFNKGKCGFKLIQYLALGKPIIASPVGVNVEIIEKSKAGLLSDTDDQWFDELENIYVNKDLYQKFSLNANKAFNNIYNTNKQYYKLKKIWCDLINEN